MAMVFDEKQDAHFLGLDLGQAVDFSALCALRQRLYWTDAGKREYHYAIRGLKRWPLGTLYPAIVRDVVEALSKPPLAGCLIGVDKTGCGAPVVDQLREAAPRANLKAVTITSGFEVSIVNGDYRIPKRELVAVLQLLLQTRRLEIPDTLPEQKTLERELMAFRARISTKTGAESFEADWRTKEHDDMILSIAIACWFAERDASAAEDVPLDMMTLAGPSDMSLMREMARHQGQMTQYP